MSEPPTRNAVPGEPADTTDRQRADAPGDAPADADADPAPAADSPADKSPDPVRRATFIVLLLAALLVAWYLRSDRVTPYTSQARLHAPVVPIAAEVSGRITRVSVGNNQVVTKDQELFQIDMENYRLAVQAAQASYEAAQQSVGGAEAGVSAADAGVAAAQANLVKAQQDYDRTKAIREQDPGAISERRLELAEASLAAARSQVEAARAQREQAIQNLGKEGDDNSRLLQAQASLDQARLNLQRATVTAPADGVVTDVRLDTGNFVSAGHPQMTFIATHNIWLQADFTENNLGHIKAGDAAHIVFDAVPGRVVEGTVREVGFGVAVDSAQLGSLPTIKNDSNWLRQSQRYPVLVSFDVPGDLDPMPLKVGSQASVVVFTGDHPVTNTLGRWLIRIEAWLTFAY